MLQGADVSDLTIVPTADLSPAHEQQIRSFIRLHWHDEYLYDLDAPLMPAERHPQHVVIAERHALFSHARITWVPFAHAGRIWRLYCLGDVFTYPAFRQRGLGGKVTAAATERIRSDPAADLAILFCDPAHADFYGRHGWEAAPNLRATKGFADREPQEGLPMVLILSDAAGALALNDTFELPGYGW
jgi:GNAT superfamily N-acetyltransferase